MTGFALHDRTIDRDRVISGVGVVLVHAALGWALLTGLGVKPERLVEAPLEVFNLANQPPIPPPPPAVEAPKNMPEKSGRASPPNLKSKATPMTAPTPEVPMPIPPQIVTAPTPAAGDDRSSGNADRVGTGTGSGGVGDGTGSGGWGDGPGGGGGGGRPARQLRGGLGYLQCDTPDTGCPEVNVGIRFVVATDGRAHDCVVTRSSGDRTIDRFTCDRIEERLRYDPARDRSGRKIAQVFNGVHTFDGVPPREPDGYDDDRDGDPPIRRRRY